MAETAKIPGEDEPLPDGLTVLQYVQTCRDEAERARKTRLTVNRRNRDAYLGNQDWSHKQPGQSAEFLPKTAVAVEQVAAVFNKALTQFGDWFSVEFGRGSQVPLQPSHVQEILRAYLENLPMDDGKLGNFCAVMTDGLKMGLLESLCVFKVHGMTMTERIYAAEPGQLMIDEQGQLAMGQETLAVREVPKWRLRVDLIRLEDYYPDPTGRGLYEIHRCERDFNHLMAMAEAGLYDPEAVAAVVTSMEKERDESRRPQDVNQDESTKPRFRKPVVIDEFWGTLLDNDGRVIMKNAVCAIANDAYLIRPPEANPFWHQESPFVAAPLVRVPFSVWHRAVYDEAVGLNMAMNEMFNLMLDGGMASVWGVKQIRTQDLEDPNQVTNGIPQGITLAVKESLPYGQKVIEQVTEGEIPRDAMAMFEALNREFTQGAMTTELKLGQLPGRQVKATEVIELQQSQASTLDSMAADVEVALVAPLLRKAWLTILQHLDTIDAQEIAAVIGDQAALILLRMSPAQRFATFANAVSFKVHGLSATLARGKEFQKFMAMVQAVATNPLLLQAFIQRYSADKTLTHIYRMLNLNPSLFEKDAVEMAATPQQIEQIALLSQLTGGAQSGGMATPGAEGGGPDAGMSADINQVGNALSGMGGAG